LKNTKSLHKNNSHTEVQIFSAFSTAYEPSGENDKCLQNMRNIYKTIFIASVFLRKNVFKNDVVISALQQDQKEYKCS
jgi:hypothetical protein